MTGLDCAALFGIVEKVDSIVRQLFLLLRESAAVTWVAKESGVDCAPNLLDC